MCVCVCVSVCVCVIFRSSPPDPAVFLRSFVPYMFLASEEGRRQEEIGVPQEDTQHEEMMGLRRMRMRMRIKRGGRGGGNTPVARQ